MTPGQEEKLDEVYDAILRMEGRFNLIDERIKNNKEGIIEIAKEHFALEKKVHADRNKVLGAIWTFASGFAASVVGFFIWLFKN